MWLIVVLVVLAAVTGVLGAIVESFLWLFTVLFAIVAVAVLLRRSRGQAR